MLQLGDLTVWDTMAIAETVAERWPEQKLWPEDPDVRAFARSICAEMHSGFHVLRECMPMNCRAMGRMVPFPDVLTDDIDRIIAIWSECHKKYSGRERLVVRPFYGCRRNVRTGCAALSNVRHQPAGIGGLLPASRPRKRGDAGMAGCGGM